MTIQEKREIIAKRFIDSNFLGFKKIDVVMGRYQNIGRCTENAFQALHAGEVNTIAEVVYMTTEGLFRFHYIMKNDLHEYIDDTLGFLSKRNTYYLVRDLKMKDIENELPHLLIISSIKNFLGRLFSDEEIKLFELSTNVGEFM